MFEVYVFLILGDSQIISGERESHLFKSESECVRYLDKHEVDNLDRYILENPGLSELVLICNQYGNVVT